MLVCFGYQHEFDTVNELMNMVTVFVKHQTASGQAPMLFVENTHAMNPSVMNVVCELAAVRVREKYALRIDFRERPLDRIHRPCAPAMESDCKAPDRQFPSGAADDRRDQRLPVRKMRQGGCVDPDFVFPDAVCDELYRASAGWPGVVDRLATIAIENAAECPVELHHIEHPPMPKSTRPTLVEDEMVSDSGRRRSGPLVFLTRNGVTLKKIRFEGTRLLIGRSNHNDLHIDSKFISRHHALMVRHGSSTLLMDLNSANGTFVNSRRVSNQVLANDDVITLGDYGLKFVDPGAKRRKSVEGISLDDTVVMMTLEDMRRVLARENTAVLPPNKMRRTQRGNQPDSTCVVVEDFQRQLVLRHERLPEIIFLEVLAAHRDVAIVAADLDL